MYSSMEVSWCTITRTLYVLYISLLEARLTYRVQIIFSHLVFRALHLFSPDRWYFQCTIHTSC